MTRRAWRVVWVLRCENGSRGTQYYEREARWYEWTSDRSKARRFKSKAEAFAFRNREDGWREDAFVRVVRLTERVVAYVPAKEEG